MNDFHFESWTLNTFLDSPDIDINGKTVQQSCSLGIVVWTVHTVNRFQRHDEQWVKAILYSLYCMVTCQYVEEFLKHSRWLPKCRGITKWAWRPICRGILANMSTNFIVTSTQDSSSRDDLRFVYFRLSDLK